MATFGGPTIPITLQVPAAQIPQVNPTPQQPQQPQPVEQPPPQPEQPKSPKLPHARYYVFPWKS